MKTKSFALALFLGTAAMPMAYAADVEPTPKPVVEPVEKAVEMMEAETATAYANAAALGNMYEIEAANIAWERSTSEDVKAFAKMLIADHTAADAKLKVLVDQAEGALPDTLDDEHQAMIDGLKEADDAAFTGLYLAQQVAAHEKALTLHTNFAEKGDREEFKTFAAETAKTVEAHLKHAKELAASNTAASN